MATKRPASDALDAELDAAALGEPSLKQPKTEAEVEPAPKKHTLDSDEEDSDDDEKYNILNENDIEGEEEGCAKMDGEIKLTPFNMTEEQEEGHFDAEGHFHWDKSKNEVRDTWLDNLEWMKPAELDAAAAARKAKRDAETSSSDDDDEQMEEDVASASASALSKRASRLGAAAPGSSATQYDAIAAYRRMLELMRPGETVKRALQRLGGGSARLSSAERWRQKRAGVAVDANAALVVELTALSNTILTRLGNMDVYEERYEQIAAKYAAKTTVPTSTAAAAEKQPEELDMYADDFDTKEKTVLGGSASTSDAQLMKPPAPSAAGKSVRFTATDATPSAASAAAVADEVLWEFKWQQSDDDVHTGYTSAQMQQWVTEGYFKDGVFVRRCGAGERAAFNSSTRIDFELYL